MPNLAKANQLLNDGEIIISEEAINVALDRMSAQITETLKDEFPLVLSIMGGAVVFTGQILPKLLFPLDFDYIHISRYNNKIEGGEFTWFRSPQETVKGRAVLVLDDLLDEGHTMAAVKEKILAMGAKSFHCAVFANKLIDLPKPLVADFVGTDVPNRYVFGFGMDAYGLWRNLPAIYAMK